MTRILQALIVTLIVMPSSASTQTVYDARTGKALTRSSTGTDGTVTTYDAATGKAIAREAITSTGRTIYGSDGRAIARTSREQRR